MEGDAPDLLTCGAQRAGARVGEQPGSGNYTADLTSRPATWGIAADPVARLA
ncbi:hypothetical protein ACXJJ3_30745 [Kribbella sp. WER1]